MLILAQVNRHSPHEPDVSYKVGMQLLLMQDKHNPEIIILENKDAAGLKLDYAMEKSAAKESDKKVLNLP